jgi:elongation factor P hydroxylase
MQGRGFPITGSIIFAVGIVLALAALGGDTSLTGPDRIPTASPAFEAAAGAHGTRMEPQRALELPNVGEIPAQAAIDSLQVPAPTRSSFMANWDSVNGATGYRLDVSTSSSFSSYVNGYHNLDVGNVTQWVVTGLNRGTTYYYRVRASDAAGTSENSDVMTATTVATVGLIIHPTFHSSITNQPNATAIRAMINQAISIYESRFRDPITIEILFRYTNTFPNGTPFPSGQISQSDWVYYTVPWNSYIHALKADAKTKNDVLANASLPENALSTSIYPTSAGGRAVDLNTQPAMFENGTVGAGGPFDGIVTLNSAAAFQFSRPPNGNNFDAQYFTEHEIDEVIGFGSRLNLPGSSFRPQDLFSWSARGSRNFSSSGVRYFSINGGSTNIVNFNQNPNFEFGDWSSSACPQVHPYVQNASGCPGQFSDVTTTSPEGVNLDVIGYDAASSPTTDVNGDGKPDFVLYKPSTQGTVAWYLNNNVYIGGAVGPALLPGWILVSVADFNRDGNPDYALFKPSTRQTAIWYLSEFRFLGSLFGPTPPSGWELVATGDFNNDGKPDYVLYNASTHQTVIWYLNNNVRVASAVGPTLPAGWSLVGIADFNVDGKLDYLLFNSSTRQTVIWYLNNNVRIGTAVGPTIAAGYDLTGAADFDGNGRPDYVLYNPSTRGTVLWYMDDNVRIGSAFVRTLPPGWTVAAP